jgi:HlyD family secretion protein
MRKLIPVFIVLALLVGGFLALRAYFRQRGAESLSSLQTVPAERGELVSTVGATGLVRANQTATLTWQTTGIIEQVQAAVGDFVESGQELAVLEQTSLPQNIILAQADLVSARRALDDIKNSQLASAQALQALEAAEDALADLDEQSALRRAEAWEALLQAQQVYSDTLETRENLDYAADSQNIEDARNNLESLQVEVDKLRRAYNNLPGDADSNPAKARALFELKMARFRLEQAERIVKMYGGEPTDQQFNQADANVELAAARLAEAELAWSRIKDGADPAQEALLEAQLADARRAYERVKDGADPDDVAAAEARVAAAQAALDMIQLEAPFDGTITEMHVKPGGQAAPGAVAVRLDDLSSLLVDVQVPEVDINRIQTGQPVSLTFDAIPSQEYEGTVTEVARVGSAVQGVVEFVVTVALTNADEAVKPGMTAAVNIIVDQLEDVLLVPNRAVRVQEGQRVVYVLSDGTLTPLPVTLGASSDAMSEVLESDLKVGDAIVLNPPTVFESNGPPPFMRR